jgi:hypothetical protein
MVRVSSIGTFIAHATWSSNEPFGVSVMNGNMR